MIGETESRKRLRDTGLSLGSFPTGPQNAITDVRGVRVGHTTIDDDGGHTGVTVILPCGTDESNAHYFYGSTIFRGRLEVTGIQVLEDFNLMSAPIFLTNLSAVGRVYNAGITYGYERDTGLPTAAGWPPIVVGIDDRILNDIRKRRLTEAHALEAIKQASSTNPAEGSVGAGAGAVAFGFKGGIGSSSRRIRIGKDEFHVGVLSLVNHGDREDLTVDGLPLGRSMTELSSLDHPHPSIVSILATDAPLLPHGLDRLTKNGMAGLMRGGGVTRPDTDCMVLSFSTGLRLDEEQSPTWVHVFSIIDDSDVSILATAAVETAEESILNALFSAEMRVDNKGNAISALPIQTAVKFIQKEKKRSFKN